MVAPHGMKSSASRRSNRGYTLIEVLAASGILSAAIGAAAALSMGISKQEELTRGQLAAVRYAETIAKLWQLGVNPSSFLLTQTQGAEGSNGFNPMSWNINTVANISLGNDSGIDQGTVEATTVSVTYTPYGSTAQRTISLDVVRPTAIHR